MGLQGLAGIKWRYLNPFGHQFKLSGRLGKSRSQMNGEYTIPMRHPAQDKLTFQTSLTTDYDQDFGKSRYIDLSSHYWHRAGEQNLHIGLVLKREHSFPNDSLDYRSKLIYPELEWRITHHMKHHTFIVRTKAKGAYKHFFSDISFTQWQGQAIARIGVDKPWQLGLRGTLGFTHVSTLEDLPLSLQFATGGAQTVRGYTFQSIGPGRVLKIASVSLHRSIAPHVYASVFFDAGNASEHIRDPWRKGAGIGILWSMPMGQCSLSLAHPIHDTDHLWRIHLSFSL